MSGFPMMFEAIRPLEGASHASWLHELRNVVSTASVAASVSRRLVVDDAASALELLCEAEQALARCRELLADGADHLRDDGAAATLLVAPAARPAAVDAASSAPRSVDTGAASTG